MSEVESTKRLDARALQIEGSWQGSHERGCSIKRATPFSLTPLAACFLPLTETFLCPVFWRDQMPIRARRCPGTNEAVAVGVCNVGLKAGALGALPPH